MNPFVIVAKTSLKALLVLTILTGGLYPIIVTASTHLLWPTEAQGSLERRRLEGEGAPFDLLTTSTSGLDPHISPESAYFQLPRVAAARHLGSEERLRLACLIKGLTEGPQWGFLGKERVSVLLLNLRMAEARRILTPKTAEPGTGP